MAESGGVAAVRSLLLHPAEVCGGWQEYITIPNPGASNNLALRTVPAGYRERVISFAFGLITGGTVANRLMRFEIWSPDAKIIVQAPASGAVPASQIVSTYGYFCGPFDAGTTNNSHFPLPDILLDPGWQWGAGVDGLQSGDQILNIYALVQRHPMGAPEEER